jgi:HSP20 family protein
MEMPGTDGGATALRVRKAEEDSPARWDPFDTLLGLRPFRPLFNWPGYFDTMVPRAAGLSFDVDLKQKDGKYVAECALPGFKKDDIEVEVRGNGVTVTAKTSTEKKEERADFVYRERYRGDYRRTIAFPSDVDPKDVTAVYKDGILEISVPAPTQPQSKKVEVKSATS